MLTGRIVASELTANDVDDGAQVGPLLDQVAGPVASFMGDGAYDQEGVWGCCKLFSTSVRAAREGSTAQRLVVSWDFRRSCFYLWTRRCRFGRAQLPYKSCAEKLCGRPPHTRITEWRRARPGLWPRSSSEDR